MMFFKKYIASAALVACASSAAAQSFEEAVETNVLVGTKLCIEAMLENTPASNKFPPAGFQYREVPLPRGDYRAQPDPLYYFDAPADTAKVRVFNTEGYGPGVCTVLTRQLSQAQMVDLVSRVVFTLFPNANYNSPTNWSIEQPRYLPLIIDVSTIGTNNQYETPGTVQVSMSFPG